MLSFRSFLIEEKDLSEIQKDLMDLGYNNIEKVSNKRLTIRIGGDRSSTLENIAQSLDGEYNPQSSASSAGIVKLDGGFSIIAKPVNTQGSGAGAEITTLVETAQCIYCAAKWNTGEYSLSDLKLAESSVDVDGDLEKVYNDLPDDWVKSCINTADILYSNFKGKKYTFHRGSDWIEKLENHFKTLNRQSGGEFSNINKWSPADIYMVSTTGERVDFTKTRNLLELNNLLHEMIQSKDIIGISLKKVGDSPKFTYVNTEDMPKYSYESYTLGKRGFFSSKDVYINFEGGTIQYRTFPTWQGEIKGQTANQGKVSGGPTRAIIKRITRTELTEHGRRNKVDMDSTIDRFYEYYSFLERSPIPKDEFIKRVKRKDKSWYVSKFLGVELIYRIVKSKKQDYILSSLIGYAASQSEMSAPFVKVS
jgi:hypothetical protein